MKTKMIAFIFFLTVISMSFPFLIVQSQSQTNTPHLLISAVSSPPLIATEEEVNKFFDNYEAIYKRKDINGFLSLFSPKAVQNHKDGIEQIKMIYTDFFNQSEEIRYRIKKNIDIYQNAVNVKGSYEIDRLNKSGKREAWKGAIQWVLTRENGGLKIISVDFQTAK
jgi:hypothetical protein